MSLVVHHSDIKDWRNVCLDEPDTKHTALNALTKTIGFAFMSVDMDGLKNEDAVDEFLWRARILYATDGTRLINRGGIPCNFTREELLPYIGIQCNVTPLTQTKFLTKVRRIHNDEMTRDKHKRISGEPTTLEERMRRKQDPLRSIVLHTLDPNFTNVEIGELDLFFSYTTLVAIRSKYGWLISENMWSRTTAKHMNKYLPEHERTEHELWNTRVAIILAEHGLLS